MKIHLVVILFVLAAALLVSAGVYQAQGGALAGPAVGPTGKPAHLQNLTISSGGGYRLNGEFLAGEAIAGGSYRLVVPRQVSGTGLMCCCSYLPCVAKKAP